MFDYPNLCFSGREPGRNEGTVLNLITPSKAYQTPITPVAEVYQCRECTGYAYVSDMWESDLCFKCWKGEGKITLTPLQKTAQLVRNGVSATQHLSATGRNVRA